MCAGYAAFVSFLAAAGYAFGAEAFWGIGFYTGMAAHTAFGLLLAVTATLMTRTNEGWMGGFQNTPDARALLVELLPVAVALPAALGFLLLFGSGMGAYNSAFGFALFVPSTALALVAVALRVARRARGKELALRASQAALLESEDGSARGRDCAAGTFEWTGSPTTSHDARCREIFGFETGRIITATGASSG